MVKRSFRKLQNNLRNPFFLSAILLSFFIYSGTLKINKKEKIHSLIPISEIKGLSGIVTSNPVKSARSNSYIADLKLIECFSENGSSSSASGIVSILIPSDIQEKLYPGKLYTASDSSECIIDNGACINISGKFLNHSEIFEVKQLYFKEWKGKKLTKSIFYVRAVSRLQFRRLMYSWGSAGGLFLALFSGCKEYTETSITEGFRNSGLSYILALSGMHLSVFGGIAFFIGKKALTRNTADFIRLGFIIFFVWFAGISASLFRAFLACTILFFSSLFRMNSPKPLSLLSACFLLHIMIFPMHAFDIGFMFSYSSLCGIILFSDFTEHFIPSFIPYKIRKQLASSVAAQTSTAGISYYFFGKIMPIGIIAALPISPLVTIFIYAGMAGTLICLALPILSAPINAIMNCLYQVIKTLVLIFGRS